LNQALSKKTENMQAQWQDYSAVIQTDEKLEKEIKAGVQE